ncbi:MAG: hypothetical protein ACREL5_02345 [Gemmatimonadales bacterium]
MRLAGVIKYGPIVAIACACPARLRAQTAWAVDPRPIIAVGSADGTEEQQFDNIAAVHRLTDGRLVVLNGKPLELRVYSAAGKLLAHIGRSGDGPGEFSAYDTELISAGGDSVVIFSRNRWEIFRLDGKLVSERTVPVAERPRSTFYRRAYTQPLAVGINACTRHAIDALTVLPAPGIRRVFDDGAGRYWVSSVADPDRHVVYAASGTPLGTVTLPARFILSQIGADFVAGWTVDDDGVEQAVAYRVTVPPGARTAAPPDCRRPSEPIPAAVAADRAADFRTALRNLLTAEEATYWQQKHYAADASALSVPAPEHARIFVLRVSYRGYAVGVFDNSSNYFCAVGVGSAAPAGWEEGTLQCGD